MRSKFPSILYSGCFEFARVWSTCSAISLLVFSIFDEIMPPKKQKWLVMFHPEDAEEREDKRWVMVGKEVDVETIDEPLIKPDWKLLEQLGASISKAMSMTLLGIDVIIDSETQHYAVIDINAFPGFEGVDDFFTHLLDHVLEQLGTKDKDNCDRPIRPTTTPSAIPTINPASSTTTRQERLAADEKETGSNKKTAAVNAANLKASQGMYIVDQSRLIDCSHRIDGESRKSDRPSLLVGDVGGDEGAEKIECLSQRRSKDAADSQGAH